MSGRRRRGEEADASGVDGALGALEARDLRELIRELLGELEGGARDRVVDRLVSRAARAGTGWVPEGPDEEAVAEVLRFVEAAKQTHYADPRIVDSFLRRATDAFLRTDYSSAKRILRALLRPLVDFEIDLGQRETLDEVLSADTGECAARYVVSTYMTSDPDDRAEAVHAAIHEVGDLGLFWKPIEEMEAVAVEPLPELDDFLLRWRSLVEKEVVEGESRCGWGSDRDRWRREVVQRLEGVEGIATLARSTRAGEDLRVWCEAIVASGDWSAALSAFEEAAEIVRGREHWRAEFLDGAALAAQELGRKDLPSLLERAWREAPSLLRLRRWLGTARTTAGVRKWARQALEACPRREDRQRGILDLVVGDADSAAKRLSAAPGLGWSGPEHPGHLLFPIFAELLSDEDGGNEGARRLRSDRGLDLDEWEPRSTGPDGPRLQAPEATRILETAGRGGPIRGRARSTMLAAMRRAAEKRVEGVTKKQRRRYYDHAAQLVAACAVLDPSPAGGQWVAALRSRYRRYPALQRELDANLGAG